MRRYQGLHQVLIVIVSIVLLAACGTTKKPNVPIPSVVAVLEKPYADLETQPMLTEAPTAAEAPTQDMAFTPSENQPTSVTTPIMPINTPNLTATVPLNISATPTPVPTTDAYPIGGIPTVSFQPTTDPYPVETQTTPNSGLPSGLSSGSAVYTHNIGVETLVNRSFTAINPDQAAVWVRNASQLNMTSPSINCSGQSTSLTKSLNNGLNACMLSLEGSTLDLSGGNVTTLGTGSSGFFALGNSSRILADQTVVTTAGDGARGASAENGGSLDLTDVSLTTVGPNATGVSINLGGSNAMLRNTVVNTTGANSPCYYTNVTLRTDNSNCSADLTEGAIVENDGRLELKDSNLTSRVSTRWGVLLYQSTSRDATTAEAEFNMRGGILNVTDANSPVFFVTNVNALISLSQVDLRAASGVILKAGAQNTWGTIGQNGGIVSLQLTNQVLKGDIQTDQRSEVVIVMSANSTLEGAINSADTAKIIALSMDATSSWTLTKNSYVPQISGVVLVENRVVNITGNNFNVYYDPTLSSPLGGFTYQLTGGGSLMPHP